MSGEEEGNGGRPRVAVPGDLSALALVGAPSVVPGAVSGRSIVSAAGSEGATRGDWAVAAVQRVDPGLGRYRSALWRFEAEAGRTRRLTPDEGAWSDTAPVVSPDGTRVAFLSDRDGVRRVWLVSAEGGVPKPLDGPEARPVEMVWLDHERLLTLYERPVERAASTPVVVDWLRYKSDGGPGPLEPTSELWLLGSAGGTGSPRASSPVLLMDGGPGRRFSCLAPDGRGGVYYAAHPRHSDELHPGGEVRRLDLETGDEAAVWRCASGVRAVTVTASGRPVALASGVPGQSVEPPRVWWADEGRRVFPDQDLECERAVLADCRPQGASRLLAAVGERVVFVATVAGTSASVGAAGTEVALYAGEAGGVARRISPTGTSVVDFSVAADAVEGDTVPGYAVAMCLESVTSPVELYLDGVQVSDLNTAWARRTRPVAPEPVSVTSADGLELQGLLYRSDTGRDVLLRVHGGPHMAFGNAFDLETQTQVAAGFHVLVPGVRGGAGLGTAFRALSVGNWGRGDYDDLMAFADWAVESGTAAPDRLYLAGGSYGGYLINWTVTRTGRFRAAVSERSLSNLMSKFGTSDNGFTVNRYEFGNLDLFGAGAAELWQRSPLSHAADVTTPLLLVHGESDQRCPVEQSEQFFAALRGLGREVVFARYPGGSHGFASSGRPEHRVHRLELILTWLREHATRT